MKKLSLTVKEQRYDDPGKKSCQYEHFIKRIKQRLNIDLSKSDYEHIVSCIKNDKPSEICNVKYLRNQSNRLMVFELTFNNMIPVNIVYDNQRKSIVTILFQMDEAVDEISHYYDIFHNKISLKHNLGHNQMWSIKNEKLVIPNETIEDKGEYWEVVSEGTLHGKRFKYEDNNLIEVM